jgi:hypothetical protein
VVDNQDPEGLHRVRIEIPGLVDKSSWAFPLTMGGGAPQRGGHIVPVIGSDVIVWFIGGDPDYVVYASAWWGRPAAGSETPQERATDGTLTPLSDNQSPELVQKLQLGRFVATVDERERDSAAGTGQLFSIEDTVSGDALIYDFSNNSWQLKGSYAVRIKADGVVDIEGAQIQLNGRRVADFPRPI